MNRIRHIFCDLLTIFIICSMPSCSLDAVSPTVVAPPINIEVQSDKEAYCINENIDVKVFLMNTGDSDLLVDGHWDIFPVLMPPWMSTGALYLLDSSENIITSTVRIEKRGVEENDFIILAPGDVISKSAVLHDRHYGDSDNYFRFAMNESETYTVVAAYQNVLAFSRTVNGNQIAAWMGEETGSKTFRIKNEDCLHQ